MYDHYEKIKRITSAASPSCPKQSTEPKEDIVTKKIYKENLPPPLFSSGGYIFIYFTN